MTRRLPVVALLLCLLVSTATAGKTALPLRGGETVLFIGNSLTAGIPESLNTMFEANGLPTYSGHYVLIWNQTFETHCTIAPKTHPELYREPGKEFRKLIKVKGDSSLIGYGQYDGAKYREAGWVMAKDAIRNGTPEGEPWDFVILQGYAAGSPDNAVEMGPDGEPQFKGPFLKHGAQLIEESKKAGAQPLLYMNWLLNPEKGGGPEDPDSYYNRHFDRLIANYELLAQNTGTPLVPVGAAMRALSHARKPEGVRTGWLIRDNVHGTACGRALLHYMMGAALSGRPARDLRGI